MASRSRYHFGSYYHPPLQSPPSPNYQGVPCIRDLKFQSGAITFNPSSPYFLLESTPSPVPTLPSRQTLESLETLPFLKADRSSIICHFSPCPEVLQKESALLIVDGSNHLPSCAPFFWLPSATRIKPSTLMPWGHFKSHNLYFIWSTGSTHESFYISRVSFLFSLVGFFKLSPAPSSFPAVSPASPPIP